MNYKEISQANQQIGWKIIKETQIVELWEKAGAEVYLVGSLKTGLLMKNRDIDLHIYTPTLHVADSFEVISKLAQNPRFKELVYINQIDTEEACIEWHVWYENEKNNRWKIDMIHILKGSRYDGVVENVTKTIIEKLTPELRDTILKIKFDIPENKTVPGIEIYRAVFSGGVRSYEELLTWQQANPIKNTLEWIP